MFKRKNALEETLIKHLNTLCTSFHNIVEQISKYWQNLDKLKNDRITKFIENLKIRFSKIFEVNIEPAQDTLTTIKATSSKYIINKNKI